MKIGLAPPNYAAWFGAEEVRRICTSAEELGFHSLWFGDHLAVPRDEVDIFGNAYLDALGVMTYVAACTSEIRLGTNVFVVPYRHPVVAAKMIATLDVLSKGRVDLGVGIGHVPGESAALGLSYQDRGRMTEEYLRVMRCLWENDCASYSGEWVKFRDLCPMTRPVQQPVPILIGGDGPRSMRRAIEFGAGWAPGQGSIAEIGERVERLRETASEAGSSTPRIVVRWLIHPTEVGEESRPIAHRGELRRPRLTVAQAKEEVEEVRALGVDEMIVDIPANRATYERNMEIVAGIVGLDV